MRASEERDPRLVYGPPSREERRQRELKACWKIHRDRAARRLRCAVAEAKRRGIVPVDKPGNYDRLFSHVDFLLECEKVGMLQKATGACHTLRRRLEADIGVWVGPPGINGTEPIAPEHLPEPEPDERLTNRIPGLANCVPRERAVPKPGPIPRNRARRHDDVPSDPSRPEGAGS